MDLSNFGVETKPKVKEITTQGLEIDFSSYAKEFSNQTQERFLPWFLKYQLKNFKDLQQTTEIKKIIEFFEKFDPQAKTKKGLLLVGRAGSGKTTTLSLMAKQFQLELHEINASDTRNKKSIQETLREILKSKSLFGKEKLILVDEVDGVSGTKDRGGVAELVKIIKTSPYPLVFAANNKEANSIKALKKACTVIDFENHSYELLFSIGEKILSSENIEYTKEELKYFIEKRASFDIRGFINDLQATTLKGKFIPSTQLETRDYKHKIDSLLQKIFYSYPQDALEESYNNEVNIDDLFLYLEEAAPTVLSKKANYLAFNELSKADVYKGRIMKWQYWRYLVYINFYLTYGISTVKGDEIKGVRSFKQNSRILKKWIYGNKVNTLRPRTKVEKSKDTPLRFIERLAKDYRCSVQKCRTQILPSLIFTFKNDKKFREAFIEKYELEGSTIKLFEEWR